MSGVTSPAMNSKGFGTPAEIRILAPYKDYR